MTTHDKPSDRVESVVGNLEMWALSLEHDMGTKAARYDLEVAVALIRDQQAECDRRIHDLYVTSERYHAMITRAEQAEAQLAAMQAR
jgi:hypothetical protein